MGLGGMALALMDADVTSTDMESVLPLLKRNCGEQDCAKCTRGALSVCLVHASNGFVNLHRQAPGAGAHGSLFALCLLVREIMRATHAVANMTPLMSVPADTNLGTGKVRQLAQIHGRGLVHVLTPDPTMHDN